MGLFPSQLWLFLVFGALSLSGHSAKIDNQTAAQTERYRNIELFQKVMHFIETNYVDEVKNSELIQGAIKGMVSTLDPHSNFLPAEVFKDMKVDTSGKFGGLGIEVGLRDNVLTVVTPMEDTPARNAGILPGDRIVKIDSVSTKGLNLTEAVSKMRGKNGSKVVLTIYRKGFEKPKEVTLTRATVKIKAVPVSTELEPGYGYLRLATFNENAASDVKKAIVEIEKKNKLKGLVFDLRMNPGGLLDQAVEVSSIFMNEGVVVSTIGRNKDQKEIKHVKKGQARLDFPMAVLVNSSTASAAEIVAGALQDQHRAVIMGEPTFGKGSVQTVIELGDDLGLKPTIARYYTPKGRSIQEKGVEPDVWIDQYDQKLLDKAKLNQDSTREKDLPKHTAGVKEDGAADPFSMEELEELGSKKKEEKPTEPLSDAASDELRPIKIDPKSEFQIREALNYLKSFEVFKRLEANIKQQPSQIKSSVE